MFNNKEVIDDYNNYHTHSNELKKINLDKFELLKKNKQEMFINETDKNKISIEFNSILNISGECIVNAANEGLLGGGGIDGAIHQACGSELNEYIIENIPADKFGARIYEGDSVITPGFNSKFTWIIHSVAPYYDEYNNLKIEIMEKTIDSIFELVDEYNIKEIILTPIGTGFYGFHMYEFTKILFEKIKDNLEKNKKIDKIRVLTNLKLMYNYFKYYFNNLI
jgi:O-acetyl-ADP-ribose deacetylase (regulator of RNase III)